MKTPKIFCWIFLIITGVVLPFAVWPQPFGQHKTEAHGGDPRVTFVSFSMQTEVRQGDVVPAKILFKLTSPLEADEKVFFHLKKPGSNETAVNADFFPALPTRRWEVGQVVEAGPISFAVPFTLEAGEYEVSAGLMEIVREEKLVRYVREPYRNEDIKNFVVGKITVKEIEPVAGEGTRPAEIELGTYEGEEDILIWEPREGASASTMKEGDRTITMVTIPAGGEYPGVALDNYFNIIKGYSDWSYFDTLLLNLSLPPEGKGGRLLLQIRDKTGRIFKEDGLRPVAGQELTKSISLLDLGGAINVSEIDEVKIFAFRPRESFSFYISGLRLVSRGIPSGKPVVTFVRLEGPQKVKRGQLFKVKPFFKLDEPIFPPHKMFVHVYRENDMAGKKGVDVILYPPIRDWPLNQEIGVDSAPLMISPDAPPGTYIIRTGLYIIVESEGRGYVKMANWEEYGDKVVPHEMQPISPVDYIKQPYTNLEIQDWEVASIEVE